MNPLLHLRTALSVVVATLLLASCSSPSSPPEVSGLSALNVSPGGVVALTGAGFGNAGTPGRVSIGGVEVEEIVSWSDTLVEVRVPQGTPFGRVVVEVVTGTGVVDAGSLYLQRPTTVSAGASHTMAVAGDGGLWGWGRNSSGQLGTDLVGSGPIPNQLNGLRNVVSVATGLDWTLALFADGSVWAWGNNTYGQLGFDPTGSAHSDPARVVGLPAVIAIAAGRFHAVAVDAEGAVWTWGINMSGELGRDPGDDTFDSSPEPVSGLAEVVEIAAGQYHTLALTMGSELHAWGRNTYGELGNSNGPGPEPQLVSAEGMSGVVAVASGSDASFALTAAGTVWAWGNNNFGVLGSDTDFASYSGHPVPTAIAGLDNIIAINSSNRHVLALAEDGTSYAWGDNYFDQLGNEVKPSDYRPTAVAGLPPAAGVFAGGSHSIALLPNGTLWAWGANGDGQLGYSPGTGAGPQAVQGATASVP